jgi:hypothetical protein
MNDLIEIVLALAAAGTARQGPRASVRVACVAVLAVAAAACAVAAITCGLTALWIYAQPHAGAAGASAIVAGVLLAMSLALLALSRQAMKPRLPPPAAAGAPLLLTEATRLVQEHKAAALMAALLVGMIAAKRDK